MCYLRLLTFLLHWFSGEDYTVKHCYSVVQHNMILHMVPQRLRQSMHQRLYSQKTPHTSPSRASYGMSFVRIWVTIDSVIRAPHCTWHFNYWSTQHLLIAIKLPSALSTLYANISIIYLKQILEAAYPLAPQWPGSSIIFQFHQQKGLKQTDVWINWHHFFYKIFKSSFL